MKILICDDEMFIRASLKDMLYELPLFIEQIDEAKNGIEALSLMKEHIPDLVFMDIRMPRLNGLDTIKEAKPLYPHTTFIILSGYSEFEYARSALALGAKNYLLKPVTPEQLQTLVNDVHSELICKQADYTERFYIDFCACYTNTLGENLIPTSLKNLNFIAFTYSFDSHISFIDRITTITSIKNKMHNFSNSFASITQYIHCFDISLYTCAIVIATSNPTSLCLTDMVNILHQKLREVTPSSYKVTSLSTPRFMSLEQVILFLKSPILRYRNLMTLDRHYTPHDFHAILSNEILQSLALDFRQLSRAYLHQDILQFHNQLKLCNNPEYFSALDLFLLQKNHLKEYLEFSIGCALPDALDGWLDCLSQYAEQHLTHKTQNIKHIDEIISYINMHYMEDIGINTIAEKLQVTPNYLSSLFHKATGKKFTHFIKELRIERAKHLLLHTNLTIKDITTQVGYMSQRHFTKLFTEVTGIYPSDYRKKFS